MTVLADTSKYYVDVNTSNLSFLNVSRYLKRKGIKNYKFLLKIYDKDLIGVNPHSKKLTKDQKAKILAEIKINPYYYIREVVRISIPGGLAKFDLHPGNLAITWSIFNSLNFIIMLPRQRYKTVSITAALSWVYFFGTTNTPMLFGNKSTKDAENNLKRFTDIRTNLPDYIFNAVVDPGKDTDNITMKLSSITNNKINIHGQAISPEEADKQGRGMSIPIWWEDEFAFLKHNKIIWNAATPAISKASEIAERDGKPHSKIISTTPSNMDSESGIFCKEVIDTACDFLEEMYDWTRVEVLKYVTDNSKNDFINIIYTWKQLGFSDEWYQKECRSLMYDWLIINREINLVWTKASDNSVFNEEQLNVINDALKISIGKKQLDIMKYNEDEGCLVKSTFFFNLYKDLDPEKTYFIGVDVAGGLDRDNSTFVISDPDIDYKPVAVFKNNSINTKYFTLLLQELIKFLPNSILFIENNSYGKAIIDHLVDIIPNNLYFDYRINDKDKTSSKDPSKISKTISYGINTNTSTRDIMMDILKELVIDSPNVISIQELYDDIRGLVYNSKGKIEHERGLHDDCIMAYLVLRYAIAHGNNIGHFLRNRSIGTVAKVNTIDPAKNHGVNIDIRILAELVANGLTFEQAMKEVTAQQNLITGVDSPLIRDKVKSKKINNSVMNNLLGRPSGY